MRRISSHIALSLAASLTLTASPLTVSAAIGDQTGDAVFGQPSGSSNLPNNPTLNASSLNAPCFAAFDAAGNLFVADYINHRVLGYRTPMTTDRVADIVIGQPDFNSNAQNNGGVSATSLNYPVGVAVTATGDLYVADAGNARVIRFDDPLATDKVADFVLGQPDFVSGQQNNGGIGAASIGIPSAVAVDRGGNVWVVDHYNCRVLEYDNPRSTNDRIADRVIGQPSFTTGSPNNGGLSVRSLAYPYDIAIDQFANVWVADSLNNRVLEYDDPITSDAIADRVLGQPSFTSNARNYTGQVDAAGFFSPSGVRLDRNGNVYVADQLNNRVLLYTAPIATSDRIADRVFGQPNFNSDIPNNGGVSLGTLQKPTGLAIDPSGNVLITDQYNNRIVILQTPTPIVTSIAAKVSATGRAKLVVNGLGMITDQAVVEINGTALATTRYKLAASDASARRLVALDPDFDTLVPPGVQVSVTVFNPLTGGRSAPIPFTR